MAKRTKAEDESRAEIERMENEGGAVLDFTDRTARRLTYRGGHPIIRRCGFAFEPNTPREVPAEVAAVLVALSDFEDATSTPHEADSEIDLPPAA